MGLDLGHMFDDAKKAAEQGMNDLLSVGGNSALGYLEDQAVKIIQGDQADKEKAVQQKVTEILQRPGSAQSLGSYISNSLQSAGLKNYGGYVLGGVCAVAVVALFLYKK